jgi:2-dehydro-3-deoxygluconokinase
VAYLSALGDDPYGRMLRELWTREGVDHAAVATDPQAYTAIYFVTHDAAGHHFHFFRSGSAASRLAPATMPLEPVRSARVFHLSGVSLAISASACDAGLAAMEAARAAGVRVSFDTNLRLKLWPAVRAHAVMTQAIRLADICLPSFDDLAALTGLRDDDAIVDHCLRLGAKVVALKLGERGALVADAHERHRIAPGGRHRRGRHLRRRLRRTARGRRCAGGGRPLRSRRRGPVHRGLWRRRADPACSARARGARGQPGPFDLNPLLPRCP